MDVFLSRSRPKRRIFSKTARILWRFIDNLQELCSFLEPREIHVNERVVEIPFVLQHLPESGRILDVGCSGSAMALQLACLGYQVTGVDVRVYGFAHPNLTFLQADITNASIDQESHDCAVLISTLEHMGLGHYGDAKEMDDRQFLDAVARYVRPGGNILITVPFGKMFEGDWYRVYDSERIHDLISGYQIVSQKFVRRLSLLEWQMCSETDLKNVESPTLPVNGVALLNLGKLG